ncbi:hypothetical protein COL82_18085 [Bacillus toyonensis]|uniref:hypothetical protein n=1 Tax=Bacillus toyonensis TaxID=155322 RepID=UPI000BF19BBB|nr:hypothetical protein [Bacillus toyonensis]PEO62771.1 hypothetical protein CN567_20100 [Bacillus toyonensis]PFX75589.1 hypothetical protein COL38_29430 [Bacillus toyonensis]PFX85669.1 hypothetical protein COL37_18945 [Bacillus toyonensis]PFZ76497.1 hypothetical protein COL82_18085 [Bacillus toyonensis]PGA03519.1 hypothetical protein COL67_24565 [Bacillus toyonensis]
MLKTKFKKIMLTSLCVGTLFLSAACGNSETNVGEEKDKQGHTPREMMLDFVNADLRHDYKTIRKLVVDGEKNKILDPNKGPQNNLSYKDYTVKEYVVDKDTIMYNFISKKPPKNIDKAVKWVRVVRTEDGFKVRSYTGPERNEIDEVANTKPTSEFSSKD